MKFLRCAHCGNIIAYIEDKGVPVVCCGEKMTVIEAGKVDASREKHIPVVTVEKNKVRVSVGSVSHPMTAEHYIMWVALQTKQGNQRKELLPNTPPEVCFSICEGDSPVAVYAYCNLHSLWQANL